MSANAIGSTRVGEKDRACFLQVAAAHCTANRYCAANPNARTKSPFIAERTEPEHPQGPDANRVAVLSARYAAQ
jgi:hypothetical protein